MVLVRRDVQRRGAQLVTRVFIGTEIEKFAERLDLVRARRLVKRSVSTVVLDAEISPFLLDQDPDRAGVAPEAAAMRGSDPRCLPRSHWRRC